MVLYDLLGIFRVQCGFHVSAAIATKCETGWERAQREGMNNGIAFVFFCSFDT